MRDFFKGKKTYLASGALALWAVAGCALGQIDQAKMVELLIESGALSALRAALAKGQ
jgi:hypothetical protein